MVTAGIVGIVVVGLAVLAKPLILLMYGNEYANVVSLMRILLIASFLNSGVRFTVANILAAMGEIKFNLLVSGVGTLMLLILDFLLIPKYGSYGVAIANCIVYAMMGLTLLVIFVNRYYWKAQTN